MSLADTVAYDLENVTFATYEGTAETVEYATPTGLVKLPAIWGPIRGQDAGYGVPVSGRSLWVRVADLAYSWGASITPAQDHVIYRYPDGYDDGTRETWVIVPQGIHREGGVWALEVQRGQG